MNILVTGASGFIGHHLLAALLAQGHKVNATVHSRHVPIPTIFPNGRLNLIYGDLAAGLQLPENLDAVIHTAAKSAWPGVTASSIVKSNVLATDNLIRHAKNTGVSRFIFLSSLSVYGKIQSPIVDETTPILNPEVYGLSKRIGEQLLEGEADLIPSISVRLPGVIGPGSVRNWLTRVMHASRAGEEIVAFNPDAWFNNAIHVTDLVEFICALLGHSWRGAEIVTTAAAGELRVKDAIGILVKSFGDRSRVRFEESNSESFTVSSNRAVRFFGYDPMPIDEMLHLFATENRLRD